MGNWAATAVTGNFDFKITQRRGDVDKFIDPQGREVLVTYSMHPASLLHGRGSFKDLKNDVMQAMELGFGTDMLWGEGVRTAREQYIDPKFEVMETPEQVGKLIERIKREGDNCHVAADTETHTFSPWTGHLLCAGFYGQWDDNTAQILPWRNVKNDPDYARAVTDLWNLPNAKWIWQNGKYDMRFLRRSEIADRLDFSRVSVHEDTMLLSYALDEASKAHDLETQAKNLLGAPFYKDEIKPWVPNMKASYINIPEPNLFLYQARDVKNEYKVWEINREQVRDDPHLEKLYTRTLLPILPLLCDIEMYGIHVDWDYVAQNRADLEAEKIRLIDELQGIAGWRCNPNSPGEVAKLLYEQFGLRIKSKKPQDTRKETLDKLPDHPAVKIIRKYRTAGKMLSTYVEAIEERAINDCIHTTFQQHVTTTGRLSSREPNIQNIPRNYLYRRMYRARPGYILLEGDYNTAELRMLAALSGDKFLTGVFLDDKRNLHDEVTTAMYGSPFTEDQRIRGKAINFGIPYGRKAFSIGEEFDISTSEAQRLIEVWFARSPEAAAFLRAQRVACMHNRTLVTIFGRKRRPGIVTKERLDGLMNEYANFHMQSPVADFTNHSGIEINPRIQRYGAHILNLVHDSILTEVPNNPECIRACALIMKEVMEDVPTRWIKTPITFKADFMTGTHWGKSKQHANQMQDYKLH
jgi:DNA polymerase-1